MKRLILVPICLCALISLAVAANRIHTNRVDIDFLIDTVATSIDSGTVGICRTDGFLHADGFIILDSAYNGQYAGLGLADSSILKLYTTGPLRRKVIDSVVCPTCPCTLDFVVPYVNIAGADSMLYRSLDVYWWVSDTTSDTLNDSIAVTAQYPLRWDIELK